MNCAPTTEKPPGPPKHCPRCKVAILVTRVEAYQATYECLSSVSYADGYVYQSVRCAADERALLWNRVQELESAAKEAVQLLRQVTAEYKHRDTGMSLVHTRDGALSRLERLLS